MIGWLGRALSSVLDIALPAICQGCGRRIPLDDPGPMCLSCRNSLARIALDQPHCQVCGMPDPAAGKDGRCAACFPAGALGRLRSGAAYEGVAVAAIARFKYGLRQEYAPWLATWMLDGLNALDPQGTALLVPIPLHPARLRERGFNQAQLLARELARLTGRIVRADLIIRVRQTRTQARLTRAERARNMKGAFEPRPGNSMGESVEGRHVVLVDDVATSGATLQAAAKALATFKPANISALAACRATVLSV